MTERHVVLGSGQIGSALARSLAAKGHEVIAVRRSAGQGEPGVRQVAGNLADRAFAEEIARGAAVLYHVMNPAYHRWPAELPPLTEGVLHAAKTSGARLVVLDNLYMYGRMNGEPMREDGAQEPCSKKGALRKAMAARFLDASARGELRLAIGRASDFVGPGIVQGHFGERFFQRVFAGKAGEVFGSPVLPHAYTYGPDVVSGLVTLGHDERALGRVWHLPTLEARPVSEWAAALGRAMEIEAKVSEVPGWAVTMLSLVSPMIRELAEMRYQWQAPYRVDDSRFRTTFGAVPTPFDEQIRATAAWARRTYGATKAA
ncbi:MAG: NAD-dependent epimerase/dehydratase family protein [Sandaracinus sp.]